MIADTSMCLHKAGRVEKGQYRDILFITFITIPKKVVTKDFFYFDEIFPGIIWMPIGGSKLIKIAKLLHLEKWSLHFLIIIRIKLIKFNVRR